MTKPGKVLFIIHDVYKNDNSFPSGPGYMTAILKKRGFEVRVCSQDVFHYSDQEMAEHFLKDESYDIIGIGFLAARFKETILGLCRVVNEYKKGAWLVLGGYGPSPIPEYVLGTTGADVVAIGEAEETIVELLECKMNGGRDLHKIAGIAYRDGDRVVVNKRRPPIRDLDSIPFPEWELFPIDEYATCATFTGMSKDERTLDILTNRGCVGRCNFCYRMEKGVRFRSIDNVIQEIKILKDRYGITYFSINDELFVATKKKLFEFRDALRKNSLKIKFTCSVRVDIFDEEIAECLMDCGCVFVNFGFESSDQKVLDLMNKRTTTEQNVKAARIAKDMKIGLGLNFIWGNIGDTASSLAENARLIKEFNTYWQLRTIRPVTPYPGCELYYEAIRRNLLTGPADFFEKFKNSDLLTVNFTEIPDKEFYELLFEANKELIIDHYEHTTKDMKEADDIIRQFHSVYFEGNYKFRGARHYDKKK